MWQRGALLELGGAATVRLEVVVVKEGDDLMLQLVADARGTDDGSVRALLLAELVAPAPKKTRFWPRSNQQPPRPFRSETLQPPLLKSSRFGNASREGMDFPKAKALQTFVDH